MELTRDYGLSLQDLDDWSLDDLLNLVFDVWEQCRGETPKYRVKRR